MEEMRYPALVVDHDIVLENTKKLCALCSEKGIEVAGIIKGACGMPSIAQDMVDGGVTMLGSSRLEQLARCKEAGIDVPMFMIRVPMLSEVPDLIRVADVSLCSELVVMQAMNEEALRQGKTHKVILMADLGDLREGYFDYDELVETAVRVENEMDGLIMAGVGTNLGCYGSVVPTVDKMQELAEIAERVEAAIGHELEYVSGGATSSMLGVYGDYMPEKINMLRIGAGILAGRLEDIRTNLGCDEFEVFDEPFTLRAEVIELKKKATHPIGTLGVNAFGQKPHYVDRGVRMRALVAVGGADFGDCADLIPVKDGIEVVGCSGDHTILDVEDHPDEIRIGDIIEFRLKYSAFLGLSGSENVKVFERRTQTND